MTWHKLTARHCYVFEHKYFSYDFNNYKTMLYHEFIIFEQNDAALRQYLCILSVQMQT